MMAEFAARRAQHARRAQTMDGLRQPASAAIGRRQAPTLLHASRPIRKLVRLEALPYSKPLAVLVKYPG